jgi:hypothetical protein
MPRRAKSVICLFLFGGVSQLDTFDMKPTAPVEVRGEYRPIATTVPGLQVCELLPQLARRMHRLALIRSVIAADANHNTGMALTGHNPREGLRPSPTDWPYFMSALQYLRRREGKDWNASSIPAHLCIPNRLGLLEGYHRAGPYGGFLGHQYDPLCTQFGRNGEHLFEPGGVNPQTLDFLPPALRLGPELTLDQLHRRYSLVEQMDRHHRALRADPAVAGYDRRQQQAVELLTSGKLRRALDLREEPPALRDRYGWNLFGQSVLLARRLVEAGVPLVTAMWDCTKEGRDISLLSWDTHWDHFKACKGWLLPGTDQALAALLDDLEVRGLLDETLVVCLSEMGRTPAINKQAGRDHWVGSYCALFAGTGIRPGAVYGKSDRKGAFVTTDPVSPKDLLATVYHLMGYGPDTLVYDRQGRPVHLYDGATPVRAILA